MTALLAAAAAATSAFAARVLYRLPLQRAPADRTHARTHVPTRGFHSAVNSRSRQSARWTGAQHKLVNDGDAKATSASEPGADDVR